MTANQYRAMLSKLGCSQVGFARLLGVSDVTSRRWARYGLKGPIAILLHLVVIGRVTLQDLQQSHRE